MLNRNNDNTKFNEITMHRKFSRRRLLATSLGVTTLFIAGCAGLSQDSGQESSAASPADADGTNQEQQPISDLPPAPEKNHPAPDFSLARLNGGDLTLAELRGTPVILNFWASWCGPCRLEMPHLQEVSTAHGDNLVVLGVNLSQRENDMDDVPAFVEEFGLTFPVVLDEDGEVAKLYKVRGQPASVFIDADGIVQTVFYGPVTKDFIEDRILELGNL